MSDDSAKSLDGAVGTHVNAITYEVMDWATEALPAHVPADDLKKLKLAAGEHLAAMLATAYEAVEVRLGTGKPTYSGVAYFAAESQRGSR
ncbi:hypothetical protein ACIF9R_35650 [Streptomyces sp. NPDC086080]|uniref:hypothetical protein n=1 Tax=Streptomyces sp. NPDC086080 TaxID=3365748 RepID=UPI0037D880E2